MHERVLLRRARRKARRGGSEDELVMSHHTKDSGRLSRSLRQGSLSREDIPALQSVIGNRAVQRLLREESSQQGTASQSQETAVVLKLMEEFITPEIQDMEDPEARAEAAFEAFSKYAKGNLKYKETGNEDLLKGGKEGNCASFAALLAAIFEMLGVPAKVEKNKKKNFVTRSLREMKFIDPNCPGNVKIPGQDYATVNRFFFPEHWHVETEDGDFDPTLGLKDNLEKVVDSTLEGFVETQRGIYRLGDKYELKALQNDAYSGPGYLLTMVASE